jgi:hypothetical protein
MGFFSGLKKVFNPGGAAISKIVGNGKDYKGILDYAMDDNKTPAGAPPTPFDPGNRTGSTINGQSGVAQPSMQLGWTNGGYQYHNSPFNKSPPVQGPPMSFGGVGQMPPQQQAMGMGGPRPGLQPPPNGGSMREPGAQPMPPTRGVQIPEQAALINSLRARA